MLTPAARIALRTMLCVPLLGAAMAMGAEDPRNVPDATPPPLGTASFVPPASIDEQPLTSESFVIQAAVANMAEIEIGGLAQSRSASSSVKAFGVQLIRDHRTALAKLKNIAADAKIALPAEIDPEHQSLRDELARLEGPAFDQKFVAAMSDGHDKAVRLFEAASQSSKLTPALRSYADSTLPTLRQHAQMAHKLESAP